MSRLLVVTLSLVSALFSAGVPEAPGQAPQPGPLASRIVHTDSTKYRTSPRVHDGAGQLSYMSLLNFNAFDTNMYFVHRGVIHPKSGIGAHFHNNCEEMFVILDGEAQFTIDGRTSTLKGPAGAPTRMGHSHGIYNAADAPVQWMNLNVTALKGMYDAFNLGDTREGAALDPVPNFMSVRFDRSLLQPMSAAGVATGTVRARRALSPTVFRTTWTYVDHILIEPGAATALEALPDLGETFYVMNGAGTLTVGTDRTPVAAGDAVPIRVNEPKSFTNTSTAPLELLVVGVAKDMAAKTARMSQPPARSGGAGRGN